jgi:isopentenyl-diphosphate delta-isomerase
LREDHPRRKADHIRISLEEDVSFETLTSGFERYRFVHCALPEISLEAVDTAVVFLGKRLQAPLLISSMTGGTSQGREINRRLARAAQEAGIGMGLGSLRAAPGGPDAGGNIPGTGRGPGHPASGQSGSGAVELRLHR